MYTIFSFTSPKTPRVTLPSPSGGTTTKSSRNSDLNLRPLLCSALPHHLKVQAQGPSPAPFRQLAAPTHGNCLWSSLSSSLHYGCRLELESGTDSDDVLVWRQLVATSTCLRPHPGPSPLCNDFRAING